MARKTMTIYTLTYWLLILNMGATSAFWQLIWTRTPHPWRPGARRCARSSTPTARPRCWKRWLPSGENCCCFAAPGSITWTWTPPSAAASQCCGCPVTAPRPWPNTPWRWPWPPTAASAKPTSRCATITLRWTACWVTRCTAPPLASWAPGASARPWPASAAASA